MKKILAVTVSLFVLAVTGVFAQIDSTRVLETSNDFAEIREAFQKRLYDVSSDFKYFYHHVGVVSPFDVDETEGGLFDRKAKIAIRKNKYFVFEITYGGGLGPGIILVNKEDLAAVVFNFNNDWFDGGIVCSQAEIDKALALYQEL
jgi:hypothetical protein